MTDEKILDLLFQRSQQGLSEAREKYGQRLFRLADNLLGNRWDAEECVNDAMLAAWNAIPPKRPEPLLPWLYATVRHIAMNRCRINEAQKRSGWMSVAFDELRDVAENGDTPEKALDREELTQALDRFLSRVSPTDRALFLGRYYAGESYAVMAQRLNMTEHSCQARVSRMRKKLKDQLKKEGLLS